MFRRDGNNEILLQALLFYAINDLLNHYIFGFHLVRIVSYQFLFSSEISCGERETSVFFNCHMS